MKGNNHSSKLADEMLAHAAEMSRQVNDNREEILTAFVARYGFNPDECEQVYHGNSWKVVRITHEQVKEVQRAVILGRLKRNGFTFWQRVCLAMAGL